MLYGVINPRIRHALTAASGRAPRADPVQREASAARRPPRLRGVLACVRAEPRRGHRARRSSSCWSCWRSAPMSSRRIRPTSNTANSRWRRRAGTPAAAALRARHRSGRPRHPVAADPRHAAVAADRHDLGRDLAVARRRSSACRRLFSRPRRDVDHAADGRDARAAEPAAGHRRRRDSRSRPRQCDVRDRRSCCCRITCA